jgi:hypothetical protein
MKKHGFTAEAPRTRRIVKRKNSALLWMKVFSMRANFSGRNIVDSAALHPGHELTGAQSTPYKDLRVLRALFRKFGWGWGLRCGSHR